MTKTKRLTEVTEPFFETKLRSWVFSGYTFLADSGKKCALYQIFSLFGSLTPFPRIEVLWRSFLIKDDEKLEDLTPNGLQCHESIDKDYFKTDPLNLREIEDMLKYAREKSVSPDAAQAIIETKISSIIKQRLNNIDFLFSIIDTLKEEDLLVLTREIDRSLVEIKDFYPRSYHKLLVKKTEVRRVYAKLKYPELYLELEKFFKDTKYRADEDDVLMGFGPRIVLGGVFYKYFNSDFLDERWRETSPFEDRNSVLL